MLTKIVREQAYDFAPLLSAVETLAKTKERKPAAEKQIFNLPPKGGKCRKLKQASVRRRTVPRPRVQQLRDRREYALPHPLTVQVALIEHGVGGHGGMDREARFTAPRGEC